MSEDRKLMQQLRDALNEYQPCDHANTEIVSAGWHDCKQCGELIRPAHYARDREDAARVAEIIAAADARLAQPEPPVQSHDEWLAKCDEYINEIAGSAIGMYAEELVNARHDLRAHLRNHPAAVPEDPPIEEVEAIITCLGDDAAQLRDKNPDCEIAANMDQAVALIRILLAIPAAAFDQALPRYLADEREVDPA